VEDHPVGRRRGIDGKELILAAALRLFSQDGIDAVSIRSVNREAGLGPAAVHYHFGTKEALVEAVLHEYAEAVASTTKQRAREILDAEGPATAHDLVIMLAAPYLDLLADRPRDGLAWVRVVANLQQSHPDHLLDLPSARLTWRAASRVYPDAKPQAVQRAMTLCYSLLVSQLALAGPQRPTNALVDLPLLIDFLSAGLEVSLRQTEKGTTRSKAGRRRAS
jgi:AcrR family transcriptional regulator